MNLIDKYIQIKNKYPPNTIIKHKNCRLEEKILDYKYDLIDIYVKLEPLNFKKWESRKKARWFFVEILREYKKNY